MRRIEPAFPDLFPLTHRYGGLPVVSGSVRLDPVEMRLLWEAPRRQAARGDTTPPRRPVRALVHAATARNEREALAGMVRAGCGLLVVLDDHLEPADLPSREVPGQVTVLAPWFPGAWGGAGLPDLEPWSGEGSRAGVLLALAPTLAGCGEVRAAVESAVAAHAEYVVVAPLSTPPADRHRLYDATTGVEGDELLENRLFHTDLARLAAEMEREASRACMAHHLPEVLLGPATSVLPEEASVAAAVLLLWARRLDLLDGVSSHGWELRRAAQALLAAGRDPQLLCREDNLRIVPGFTPWVEAFARAVWHGTGEPFDEVRQRWSAS
jgi:hypothetical protein